MIESLPSPVSETETESAKTPLGLEKRGSVAKTVPLVWRTRLASKTCAFSCCAWRAETSGQTIAQIRTASAAVTTPETVPVSEPKIERKPADVRTAEP